MAKKSGQKKKVSKKPISNIKKANLRRHKLVKAGKLKPKSTPRFVQGGQFQSKGEKQVLAPEELAEREKNRISYAKKWEDEAYTELGQMMDPEDLEYLMQIHGKSKGKKRLPDELSDEEYEDEVSKRHNHRLLEDDNKDKEKVALLPIRTKDGKWISRSQSVAKNGSENGEELPSETSEGEESSNESESDEEEAPSKPVSVIDIVAKRKVLLHQAKVQIGSMSSSFLEMPEERLHILQKLLKMMSGQDGETDVSIQHTVSKLASASLLEIIKDTLPNYKIAEHDDKSVKLKKDTLKLHKYETDLLNIVKNYLGKLSKMVRTGLGKGSTESSRSISRHSFQCLCQLFMAHPNFNFTRHIVQFIVPYLDCGDQELRSMSSSALEDVFRNDKRGEVSFTIVKQINHFIKTKKSRRGKLHADVLMPLLAIKLYHLSDNQLTENEAVQKLHRPNLKGLSKKNKHLAQPILSKKEKKRAKEKEKLDRELLEARGEESAKNRLKFATEISNILFAIYFRTLKGFLEDQSFSTAKLLHPVLNGLAKFGHLMSIEYFQDVLKVIKILIDENCTLKVGNYEKLLCLKTVFAILSGQGDSLTLDPARFYTILNNIILQSDLNDDQVFSSAKDREYFAKSRQSYLVLSVLRDALIQRRKKISKSSAASILKKTCISLLQQSSDATLATIKFIRECLFVAHPQLTSLLTLEGEAEEDGSILANSGLHLPKSEEKDPFGISSGQSLLWEASLLASHVSPKVSEEVNDLLDKKSSKARKRPRQLAFPPDTKDTLEETEAGQEENSCFDILSNELPEMVAQKKRK